MEFQKIKINLEKPEKSIDFYSPGNWIISDLNDCLQGNSLSRDVIYKIVC